MTITNTNEQSILHPAVTKAMEIYDRPGDLEPYQQEFLLAVHKIRGFNSKCKETAVYMFGLGSRAALASHNLSNRQESCDLTKALARYQEALEKA